MKNDTSPSARQPYSYADALRSLLIIPPSDRQPDGAAAASPSWGQGPGLVPGLGGRVSSPVSPPCHRHPRRRMRSRPSLLRCRPHSRAPGPAAPGQPQLDVSQTPLIHFRAPLSPPAAVLDPIQPSPEEDPLAHPSPRDVTEPGGTGTQPSCGSWHVAGLRNSKSYKCRTLAKAQGTRPAPCSHCRSRAGN